MSAIANVSLRVDKLPKEKFVKGKDGAVYYNFTVSINDEPNQFLQNVTITDSQTQEEREAKKAKLYLGNGNVVWTDGKIVAVKRDTQEMAKQTSKEESADLPF